MYNNRTAKTTKMKRANALEYKKKICLHFFHFFFLALEKGDWIRPIAWTKNTFFPSLLLTGCQTHTIKVVEPIFFFRIKTPPFMMRPQPEILWRHRHAIKLEQNILLFAERRGKKKHSETQITRPCSNVFHMIQNEMQSGAHMHWRIEMNQNVFGVRCSFHLLSLSRQGACILSIWHSGAFFPTINSLAVQARFFFETFFTRPLNTGEKIASFFGCWTIACARAHITYHEIQFGKELHFLLLFPLFFFQSLRNQKYSFD